MASFRFQAVIYVHWLLMFDSYAYVPVSSVWVSAQKHTNVRIIRAVVRFEQQQQQQQRHEDSSIIDNSSTTCVKKLKQIVGDVWLVTIKIALKVGFICYTTLPLYYATATLRYRSPTHLNFFATLSFMDVKFPRTEEDYNA
uniref:Uncharacterized protein n=1 Tax=Glossina austeni TaxID=7395 RepID=A0A1A9VGZ0_GLOAU